MAHWFDRPWHWTIRSLNRARSAGDLCNRRFCSLRPELFACRAENQFCPLGGVLERSAKLIEKTGRLQPSVRDVIGAPLADLIESGEVQFTVDPKFPQAIGIANILQHVASLGNSRWEVLLNEHGDCRALYQRLRHRGHWPSAYTE